MVNKDKIIVVGAGVTGITLAERLTNAGKKVLLIDKRNHIGGNCYDYYNSDGILVPAYGPHFFHTDSERVWEYVNKFGEWIPYTHKVLAEIDGELKIIPPTADYASKAFNGYTKKQWGKYADKLNASVRARVKIRTDYDDCYFKDKYQAMPKYGYTKMFEKMLVDVEVMLNTDYFETDLNCNYYTGRLDEFFKYKYGKLPFRSLHFKYQTLKMKFYQPVAVVNYPQTKRYIRITEPKHATGQKNSRTTIIREYPSDIGEPYYPIPTKKSDKLRDKYLKLTLKSNVCFAGRLGGYEYINMDKAIESILNLQL